MRRSNLLVFKPEQMPWEISGQIDSEKFFSALHLLLDEHAVLYFEEVTAPDVSAYLKTESLGQPQKVKHLFGPPSWCFNVPASLQVLGTLAEMAVAHCEYELCFSLTAYKGDRVLLQWGDAWADPLYLAADFPEEQISRFCEQLGARYARVSQPLAKNDWLLPLATKGGA